MGADAARVREWFAVADLDRDGSLSGPEAVSFFKRSGLEQSTLAQVWETSAGTSASLSLAQFWTAVQLVSLAQREGGSFTAEQAASLTRGAQGHLPLPRIAGLEHQPTGPPPQQQQHQLGQPSSAASSRRTSDSGMPYPPPAPGDLRQRDLPGRSMTGGGWPPMTVADYQRYVQEFQALDMDRDGWVSGADCFPTFIRSGVPRDLLKGVWDLIAGSRGSLSAAEFLKAEYLIDCVKKGIPLPSSLPLDHFPPTVPAEGAPKAMDAPLPASNAGDYSIGGPTEFVASRRKRSSLEVPQVPALEELKDPGPAESKLPAHVPPAVDKARLKCLPGDQKERLEAELAEAQEKAAKLSELEASGAGAARRSSHCREQLSRLRIAKSRIDNIAMQAQDKVRKHRNEAEATTARYNSAVKALEAEHGESMALMERGMSAVQRRQAAEEKLAALHLQLQAAAAAVPNVPIKDPVVDALESQLAKKETEVAAALSQALGYAKQAELLRAKMSSLQLLSSPQTVATVSQANQTLQALRQRAADPSSDKQAMVASLTRLHAALSSHAEAAGVPVPKLAVAPQDGLPVAQVWAAKDSTGDAWCSFSNKGVNHVNHVAEPPAAPSWSFDLLGEPTQPATNDIGWDPRALGGTSANSSFEAAGPGGVGGGGFEDAGWGAPTPPVSTSADVWASAPQTAASGFVDSAFAAFA